jgi:hypothetical protein
MSDVLLTAGAASIILAVVGGGAKALGVEVPVLTSRKRQAGLALVGIGFLAMAVLLREGNDAGGPSDDVTAYRQHVLAACRGLREVGGQSPPLNPDGTIDRDAFMAWAMSQLETSTGILDGLWERSAPDALKDERAEAKGTAADLAGRTETSLDKLEEALPTRFSLFPSPPPALAQFNAELATPSQRFEASMSELAGQPCRPVVAGSTRG